MQERRDAESTDRRLLSIRNVSRGSCPVPPDEHLSGRLLLSIAPVLGAEERGPHQASASYESELCRLRVSRVVDALARRRRRRRQCTSTVQCRKADECAVGRCYWPSMSPESCVSPHVRRAAIIVPFTSSLHSKYGDCSHKSWSTGAPHAHMCKSCQSCLVVDSAVPF